MLLTENTPDRITSCPSYDSHSSQSAGMAGRVIRPNGCRGPPCSHPGDRHLQAWHADCQLLHEMPSLT